MNLDNNTHSKYSARTNYDRWSRWYDLLTFNPEQNLSRKAIQKLDLQQGGIILEIGCGTGTGLLQLAQNISPPGMVLGFDLSRRMLLQAKKKIRTPPTAPAIHLIQGDGEMLPFLCGSIDVIFMSFTLEVFDNATIQSVLAECWRSLRPGGRVCVVGLSQKPGNISSVRIYKWFHEHFPTWIDCRPILIEQAVSSAGFRIIDAELLSLFGLPVEIVTANR